MTEPGTETRKVALITGAARGIGRAIAQAFARDYWVAGTWNTTAPGADMSDVLWVQADLTQPGSAEQIISDVIAQFGRLDVIVNNAGIIASSPPDTFDPDGFRAMFDVNLFAPHGLLAAALPHLKPGAAIVSISSANAVFPPKEAALYGASKAALNLWTRGLAKELGPSGIRVNAVAPGAVNVPESPRDAELTQAFVDLTALGRLATPEDIAAAVRFLASDQAASITGETLTVSGGYRL